MVPRSVCTWEEDVVVETLGKKETLFFNREASIVPSSVDPLLSEHSNCQR